jgi:hypothetical protein
MSGEWETVWSTRVRSVWGGPCLTSWPNGIFRTANPPSMTSSCRETAVEPGTDVWRILQGELPISVHHPGKTVRSPAFDAIAATESPSIVTRQLHALSILCFFSFGIPPHTGVLGVARAVVLSSGRENGPTRAFGFLSVPALLLRTAISGALVGPAVKWVWPIPPPDDGALPDRRATGHA